MTTNEITSKDIETIFNINLNYQQEICARNITVPLEEQYKEILSRFIESKKLTGFKKHNNNDFFVELASKLRELWPAGDKDGKWPWRESVENLSKRLETLWNVRSLGEFSIDQCLSAANRYLARFEEDAKYMKILKYFILKQTKIVNDDGKITFLSDSPFADILEGKKDEDALQNEWNNALSGEETNDLFTLI